jgi:hypothetical protein
MKTAVVKVTMFRLLTLVNISRFPVIRPANGVLKYSEISITLEKQIVYIESSFHAGNCLQNNNSIFHINNKLTSIKTVGFYSKCEYGALFYEV